MGIVQTFVVYEDVFSRNDGVMVRVARIFMRGPFGEAEYHGTSEWWAFKGVGGGYNTNYDPVAKRQMQDACAAHLCAFGIFPC